MAVSSSGNVTQYSSKLPAMCFCAPNGVIGAAIDMLSTAVEVQLSMQIIVCLSARQLLSPPALHCIWLEDSPGVCGTSSFIEPA